MGTRLGSNLILRNKVSIEQISVSVRSKRELTPFFPVQDQQESSGRSRITTTALRPAVTTPSFQTSAVSSQRKTPSSTSPEPVSSTTTSANTTSPPPHSTSSLKPTSQTSVIPVNPYYTEDQDATICRMLSEGSIHKEIAKVLARSTTSVSTRVWKLREKGE